ncbi:MAG TPA: regulatory protein RecX [Candidatus Saccharimonadales bacterium]|nr:regulatory protein RecX [Candidatus Saccharimonadales bacterium]
MFASPSEDTAYLMAVRYLGYRPRSIKEIQTYLKKKQVSEAFTEAVIKKLLEQKFLNDTEFAQMWVRTRVTLKPLSQKVLRMELKEKGIASDIIDSVLLEQQAESGSDFEMARLLVQKRQKRYIGMPKEAVFAKLGGFLARRGFSYDIIKRSIDEVFTF